MFDLTIDRLIEHHDHPPAVRDLGFRPDFPQRGLLIDKQAGTVLRMSRHRFVNLAYFGRERLGRDELKRLYRYEPIQPASGRFYHIDSLFELPEANLYAELVEASKTLPAAGRARLPGAVRRRPGGDRLGPRRGHPQGAGARRHRPLPAPRPGAGHRAAAPAPRRPAADPAHQLRLGVRQRPVLVSLRRPAARARQLAPAVRPGDRRRGQSRISFATSGRSASSSRPASRSARPRCPTGAAPIAAAVSTG